MHKKNCPKWNPNKQIFVGFIALALILLECTPAIREPEKYRNDQQFIPMPSTLISEKDTLFNNISSSKYERFLKQCKTPADWNNLAIIEIRLTKILLAEEHLQKQLYETSDLAPFLNLLRLYYIAEAIPPAKKLIHEYVEKTAMAKPRIEEIRRRLSQEERDAEEVLFLDKLSQDPKYKLEAFQGIGDYYLKRQFFHKAYFYFEQILIVEPYDPDARFSMAILAHDLENWADLKEFSESLISTKDSRPSVHFFAAKANYELAKYEKAVEYINSTPAEERSDPQFLELWKAALLSINPNASLEAMRPFVRRLIESGFEWREDDFLFLQTEEGIESRNRLKNGR